MSESRSITGKQSQIPEYFATIGICLAIFGATFSGMSMILQKKGILDTRKVALETGNDKAYLKSYIWWMVGVGEILNSVAYSFAPAIIVAPMTSVQVVVSAIMSVLFLKESLNFSATAGICLCIIGAIILVLNGPKSTSSKTLPEFFSFVLAPGFMVYTSFILIALLLLVFKLGPQYGHAHPAVYLSITALAGAYLVCSAQGLGTAIVWSVRNWDSDNQFLKWEFYPLLLFVVYTIIFQVKYLNKALAHFSASIVTPLKFVFFSTSVIITTSVLYQGFNVSSATAAVTMLLGFGVVVFGVSLLLQYNLKMSKLQLSIGYVVNDINDQEVSVDEFDLNPLLLLQKTYPLSGSSTPIPTEKSKIHSMPLSEENYVRINDEVVLDSDRQSPSSRNPTTSLFVEQQKLQGRTLTDF
ncbi:hypothetical protein HDV02_004493 [Globomyces sp. JEL0801]|nr:hypothetical protein HDV02_004493 [Globomyces sp. JEL0801]